MAGIMPVFRPMDWQITASFTAGADNPGWGGYTMRAYITAAAVSINGGSMAQARLRIPAPAAVGLSISKCYFGHVGAGDAFDFDGTQVQVQFSGSTSLSLAAGAATIYSDSISYLVDETKGLVVSIFFTGVLDSANSVMGATGMGTNYGYAYKAGDDAATTDASSYNNATNRCSFFDRIEVLT